MTTDATNAMDWHQVLSRVSGTLVRGQQRVTTRELLNVLGVPVTDSACRRLRRVMRDLGWRGRHHVTFAVRERGCHSLPRGGGATACR